MKKLNTRKFTSWGLAMTTLSILVGAGPSFGMGRSDNQREDVNRGTIDDRSLENQNRREIDPTTGRPLPVDTDVDQRNPTPGNINIPAGSNSTTGSGTGTSGSQAPRGPSSGGLDSTGDSSRGSSGSLGTNSTGSGSSGSGAGGSGSSGGR